MTRMISSFAPLMERALRLHLPALQQRRLVPHRHHGRGELLLTDSGCPRPDRWVSHKLYFAIIPTSNFRGVPLCHRFVKPVVCPASPVQLQTRVFSDYMQYRPSKKSREGEGDQPPKKPWDEFCKGMYTLSDASRKMKKGYIYGTSSTEYEVAKKQMLRSLGILEKVDPNMDYCSNDNDAEELLDAVMVPISEGLHGLDDGAHSSVVEASLKAICQLLQTATREISNTLCRKISSEDKVKSSLERIRYTGKQAEEILAQLPSTPK